MKKTISIGILIFLICTTTKINSSQRNSGKKFVFPMIDYRDVYVGTYSCKRYFSKLSSVTKRYESGVDQVNIVVVKDDIDSLLQIKFGSEVLKVKLRNKILWAYPSGNKYGGGFYATDSLDFYSSPNRASSSRYLGKKL